MLLTLLLLLLLCMLLLESLRLLLLQLTLLVQLLPLLQLLLLLVLQALSLWGSISGIGRTRRLDARRRALNGLLLLRRPSITPGIEAAAGPVVALRYLRCDAN